MRTLTSSFVIVFVVSACTEAPVPTPTPTDPSLVVTRDGPSLPFDHPPVLGGGAAGGAAGGPAGGGSAGDGTGGGVVVAGPASAGSRRLSTRQLAKSMETVLGGSVWTVGSANGFDARSRTLGEPDYIAVVDENLEPSALFLKFMDDAAKDGCTRALTADQARAANQRVLYKTVGLTDTVTSNRAAVDQNLGYLKLRFHGIKVVAGDETTLGPLRTLFDDAVKGAAGTATPTAAHVREGWRAVCVALLMAPEYHLY
ncbi:MAG: hypothetical protein INH37_23745 [Myxococcaceae bacterium]|nr:hypothetical protein [Myxococcaceae bacterium]